MLAASTPAAHRQDALHSLLQLGKTLGMEGVDLLSSLLQLDPQQRSTPVQALQAKFLRNGRLLSATRHSSEEGGAMAVASVAGSTRRPLQPWEAAINAVKTW